MAAAWENTLGDRTKAVLQVLASSKIPGNFIWPLVQDWLYRYGTSGSFDLGNNLGLLPGPKTRALELLWGSILTITGSDIWLLAVVAVVITGLAVLFFKEIQAVIFHREMARAVGIPADAIFYSILFLTGATVTASLRSIGGLLIFNLILNPAAAAYQLTYSLKYMFFLAALFGVLSCWAGLGVSYILDVPSGAAIVLTSAVIFVLATIFSPKRKVKQWQENE
ncbi:metal ABC transporter permease [Moorella sp. Hama-1]|uniref:metal ABC transporter permease n=1 Tax=Moorella sp. Hama-1 TaxID=2138101 RepID=UPI001F253B85|nr:metal ABC transporter permease [Moorella sp. Hama-1]